MAIVRYTLDPANPPRLDPERAAYLDGLTDEELTARALADPDNPPLTDDELARVRAVRFLRALRERLDLTQAGFAARFHIPLGTLRDWEQGRRAPDATARAYLAVLAHAPEAVDAALASWGEPEEARADAA